MVTGTGDVQVDFVASWTRSKSDRITSAWSLWLASVQEHVGVNSYFAGGSVVMVMSKGWEESLRGSQTGESVLLRNHVTMEHKGAWNKGDGHSFNQDFNQDGSSYVECLT